jgi:hypothetical protein
MIRITESPTIIAVIPLLLLKAALLKAALLTYALLLLALLAASRRTQAYAASSRYRQI